ncbi:MAG: HsdM family class I SAM-dependent methyltransferase [Candidatus Heimdallarchaeaceae archaeon]
MLSSKYNYEISFVATPPEIVDLMVGLIPNKKYLKILDTGCGKGAFLQSLIRNKFHNVEGIELNSSFANFCKNKYAAVKIYNEDFLTWKNNKKYDIIIGNPPYAHYNSLPEDTQKIVYEITKTKETDIYYAFIIKSIDLLQENGVLIYIVPYGFLYATHAKTVREKIVRNGFLELIIDLDESRLFNGENPETIIFKFRKKQNIDSKKTHIIYIKSKNATLTEIKRKARKAINDMRDNDLFFFHKKILSKKTNSIWSTHPSIDIPFFWYLKEIAFIGVGMVSGFDKSFILDDKDISQFNEKERAAVFPFIKGKHCKGFWVEGKSNYILLDNLVSTEEQLSSEFPNIYKILLKNKEEMSNRYLPNGKKWYNWQALRNYVKHKKMIDKPKIFVPTLDRSKKNRFSLTYEKVYPSGDVLSIVPKNIDPFFLLGYLNSDFFRNYYLAEGARRGHRISFTQRILSNIKIPRFNKIIRSEISRITRIIFENKNKELLNEINIIIKKAFTENNFEKEKGLLKYF